MMDSESNGRLFKLVDYQKKSKKPCTAQENQLDTTYQFEMPICTIHRKSAKSSTDVPVAAHVKKLISTMKLYDLAFSFLVLNHQTTYHLNNDKFPKTEEGFNQFFFLHPKINHPALPKSSHSQMHYLQLDNNQRDQKQKDQDYLLP